MPESYRTAWTDLLEAKNCSLQAQVLNEGLEAAISVKECDVQSGDEPFPPGLTLRGSCNIVHTDGGGIIPVS